MTPIRARRNRHPRISPKWTATAPVWRAAIADNDTSIPEPWISEPRGESGAGFFTGWNGPPRMKALAGRVKVAVIAT